MKKQNAVAILRIVLPYVVFAGLWILLSDRLLEFWELDTATQTQWSIYKGWAFVAVTALLLSLMLRKELNIRAQDQAALRQSEERLRVLGDNLPDSYVYQYTHEADGTPRFLYLSAGVEKLHGLKVEEVLRDAGLFNRQTDPELVPALKAAEAASARNLTDFTMEMRIRRADGQWRWIQLCSRPRRTSGGQVVWDGVATDITEHKRAEAEREKLQAQLIQAQRMESVGRLAGGVAHDFNNMLGVILGYMELALKKVGASSPLHADLVQVQKAAERSAEITRQLLAFARKQTISPRVLDLNETVEGMLKMLRRLIEENIDLVWQPKVDLWPVKMDPTQIDQILANLCINARDAIAGAGKLIIETGMVTLDEAYCAKYAGSVPGDYVLLAVSDNGCGMDPETLSHLFEPFFTTKEVGKGTGLGLATVYGIVKQNSGFINAYSEPEKGTTFKIYLPRHVGERAPIAVRDTEDIPRGNGEIVLVVEDDATILELTQTMLTGFGYRVLEAPTPASALKLAGEHAGAIHLLITDVVMPVMNGRDLAKRLQTLYPELKVLFMSGYTAEAIADHGVLDQGVRFMQKPFSLKDIACKVRQALDEK